jgi:hypothetical protein
MLESQKGPKHTVPAGGVFKAHGRGKFICSASAALRFKPVVRLTRVRRRTSIVKPLFDSTLSKHKKGVKRTIPTTYVQNTFRIFCLTSFFTYARQIITQGAANGKFYMVLLCRALKLSGLPNSEGIGVQQLNAAHLMRIDLESKRSTNKAKLKLQYREEPVSLAQVNAGKTS